MEVEHEQRFIIDRVGEETDLEECSLCFAASCFSMNGNPDLVSSF